VFAQVLHEVLQGSQKPPVATVISFGHVFTQVLSNLFKYYIGGQVKQIFGSLMQVVQPIQGLQILVPSVIDATKPVGHSLMQFF